jgi:hypothetical protein
MIGEAPRTKEFKRQFDWPDAVIHVPFDSPDIGRILAELNGDPERLRAVRRNNVRKAALRHDWLHRIQVVFDSLGLTPTEKMRARAQRLDQIACASAAPLWAPGSTILGWNYRVPLAVLAGAEAFVVACTCRRCLLEVASFLLMVVRQRSFFPRNGDARPARFVSASCRITGGLDAPFPHCNF